MLEPLFARVLLKREKFKSKSSLIIPETAEKRHAPARGVVLAVGPTADQSIQLGQTVLFGKYAGDWIKDGEEEIYICQDEDILCIVKEPDNGTTSAN